MQELKIILDDNATLNAEGDMTLDQWNHLQLNEGATLDMKGNNFFMTNDGGTGVNNKLTIIGVAGNRGKIIDSVGGAIFAKNVSGHDSRCLITMDYFDIRDIGTWNLGTNNWAEGNHISMKKGVFADCDTITFGGFTHVNNNIIIENVDLDGSPISNRLANFYNFTDANAATISVKDLTFRGIDGDEVVRFNFHDLDAYEIITDKVLPERTTNGPVKFHNMFAVVQLIGSSGLGNASGDGDELIESIAYSGKDNPHTIGAAFRTISGCIIESTFEDETYTDDGDHFIVPKSGTYTVENTLILTEKSDVALNALSAPAAAGTYEFNHNTMVGNYDAAYGAICRTENGGTWSGTLNLRSNITYDKSATAGSLGFNMDGGSPPDDQVTNMDYNNWHNIENKYNGVTSATKTPGVTADYGGNDLEVDPEFYDDTRKTKTWNSVVNGGAETAAATTAHLLKLNGYDPVTRTQVPEDIITTKVSGENGILNWIRTGFTVTNSSLQNSGHDSNNIGILEDAPEAEVVDAGGKVIQSPLQGVVSSTIEKGVANGMIPDNFYMKYLLVGLLINMCIKGKKRF